jgi:cellulose synthase/poly-beta-1,6-N-acetylglucosamine synthase-like glycosyltransferase
MIADAVNLLLNQSVDSLVAMFWILVFIEAPRYFVGTIVMAWFLLFHREAAQCRPENNPCDDGITVVVPGHNDAASIQKTVLSLREQTCRRIQVIVVNDGSTDGTDRVCRQLERERLIDTYLEMRTRGGKSAAVNAALALARYPLFMVTDSDTTFDRDALEQAALPFADPTVGVVGGNLRVRNLDRSMATHVQQLNYGFSITLGRIVKDALGFYFVASGAFGLYRTEAVRWVGGWDFGPGEDGDILTRLRLAGWRARFAHRATAMTDVPETFIRLARQRIRWDRSMIRNRFRKTGPTVLNPFRPGFDLAFAVSFLDIFFFSGVTPFLVVVYLADTFVRFGSFGFLILLAVAIAYFCLSFVKFFVMLGVSTRPWHDLALLPYLPLLLLTSAYFLRAVRLYANTNELVFRGSYGDAYVPVKVRKRIDVY